MKPGFLTLRIPAEWIAKLDQLAADKGTSRSDEARAAIEKHVRKVGV